MREIWDIKSRIPRDLTRHQRTSRDTKRQHGISKDHEMSKDTNEHYVETWGSLDTISLHEKSWNTMTHHWEIQRDIKTEHRRHKTRDIKIQTQRHCDMIRHRKRPRHYDTKRHFRGTDTMSIMRNHTISTNTMSVKTWYTMRYQEISCWDRDTLRFHHENTRDTTRHWVKLYSLTCKTKTPWDTMRNIVWHQETPWHTDRHTEKHWGKISTFLENSCSLSSEVIWSTLQYYIRENRHSNLGIRLHIDKWSHILQAEPICR